MPYIHYIEVIQSGLSVAFSEQGSASQLTLPGPPPEVVSK